MQFNYNSAKWTRLKNKVLKKDKYLDYVELMYGRHRNADTVHHIYPVKDYPEYAFCEWNLICVSIGSHNKLENRRTGQLTKLGEQIKKSTIPGVNWRTMNE